MNDRDFGKLMKFYGQQKALLEVRNDIDKKIELLDRKIEKIENKNEEE